ncbi:MAG: aminotransferase class V-fold PLP-dependent enzyme, partial [Clostridia bacterium]|nr:aminotransferase class V-fold PLP-dependent enzyme [Clostridia bacterium]
MNTPICDFVAEYQKKEAVRLHMPGHKGTPSLGPEAFDITEINGADTLYNSSGIIKESQENAALLFGTEKTVYSAEGSSLSIRAMLYLIKLYAERNAQHPLILAARNAHKSFVTAAAILDVDVKWLFSNDGALLSYNLDVTALENALISEKPTALYLTSPDYLGNIVDIAAVSKLCKKYGVILAVDNAHGAYLKFLPKSLHPIDLGADICCDSAHKTLPVITGGGYLHVSKNAPALFAEEAEYAMSLFASTSPSYLIMQSLDMANKLLSEEKFKEETKDTAKTILSLKKKLLKHGFSLVGDEPLKLTLAPKSFGYSGSTLSLYLEEQNIISE